MAKNLVVYEKQKLTVVVEYYSTKYELFMNLALPTYIVYMYVDTCFKKSHNL